MVGWLIVTGRLRPSADYLVACRPYLGEVAAHHHRAFHERFAATSAGLGFEPIVTRLQWSALAKVTAVAGLDPEQVTQAVIDEGRQALTAAIGRHRPGSHGPGALSAALFGLQTTLFHLGVLDTAPRKTSPNRSAERAAQWAVGGPAAGVHPGRLHRPDAAVAAGLDHGARRGRAARVRLLAGRATPRRSRCVADLRRRHIEAYKLHLASRPSARGGKLSRISLAEHLGALRTCFERLTEWDGDDIPAAVLVFSGDLPLRDEPLPRFLDDGAFTKLLQATRADPDPFVRLAVEFLARTGLRKGEFLDLTVDSVVQIGAAYWLHVPLGKLRTDRYIPLHPQLKDLLDDWLAEPARQPAQPLPVHRARPAHPAGPRRPRPSPEPRRPPGSATSARTGFSHTLATQAINRGMSLEAIAALLGHRSMRMTMVYARIANRTVAEEYFAVSEKVEALYDAPQEPARRRRGHRDAQAPRRDAPADARQRLLRPPGRPGLPLRVHLRIVHLLPDHHRVPSHPATPARRRRRKGQVGRQKIFDGLLARLEESAS